MVEPARPLSLLSDDASFMDLTPSSPALRQDEGIGHLEDDDRVPNWRHVVSKMLLVNQLKAVSFRVPPIKECPAAARIRCDKGIKAWIDETKRAEEADDELEFQPLLRSTTHYLDLTADEEDDLLNWGRVPDREPAYRSDLSSCVDDTVTTIPYPPAIASTESEYLVGPSPSLLFREATIYHHLSKGISPPSADNHDASSFNPSSLLRNNTLISEWFPSSDEDDSVSEDDEINQTPPSDDNDDGIEIRSRSGSSSSHGSRPLDVVDKRTSAWYDDEEGPEDGIELSVFTKDGWIGGLSCEEIDAGYAGDDDC